jgi:predicted alpha/beta-hydrolase family hydrolase
MAARVDPITIPIADGSAVPGLLCLPEAPRACFVFAHGAGAGMDHAFMAAMAEGLAQRGVATLRFQFPFMARGTRRPDTPPVARAAVRAAVAEARRRLPDLPLFAGGKSFGGRMSSQAQAEAPLEGVRGIVFVGFPLHPAGKPSQERAAHLREVGCPMLFLQGTRDELADLTLLQQVLKPLGDRVTLQVIEDADHAFHVRARSGRTDAEVRDAMIETMVAWFG